MRKDFFDNKPLQLEKVYAYIQKFQLFSPNERVLCALSGGADSVCLLHILLQLAPIFQWTILAIHLNHHLRGAESDSDETFCREICAKWGVELSVRDLNCGKKAGVSLEEDARNQRYSAFLAVALEKSCSTVATAHTLSDQAETIILRLCRGTGPHGLQGIPRKRVIDNHYHSTNVKQQPVSVARPLLPLTRQEVEGYLNAYNQPFVSDSTNADTIFARNRVRSNILPEMAIINQKSLTNICRTSEIISLENEYLELQARDVFQKVAIFSPLNVQTSYSIDLKQLLTFHVAIQHRIIVYLLTENSIASTFELVEKIMTFLEKCKSEDKNLQILRKLHLRGPSRAPSTFQQKTPPTTAYLALNMGILSIEHRPHSPTHFRIKVQLPILPAECPCLTLKIPCKEAKKWLYLRIQRGTASKPPQHENINRKFANNVIDCGKLKGDIYLRSREPGDRLRLPQRGFSCDLRKRFQGIEPGIRPYLFILADDNGPFFAETLGIDERVVPEFPGCDGDNSKCFMEISTEPMVLD